MEFYVLQNFLTFTKGTVYVLMGAGLVLFVLWWKFLFSREPENHSNVQ